MTHPWIRAEDIEALGRLLERDVRQFRHLISLPELRRWMDADERFAAYVREHHAQDGWFHTHGVVQSRI